MIGIRWFTRADLMDVMAIDFESFEHSWGKDEFLRNLRHQHVIGMVAVDRNHVVGFMIYELRRNRIDLLRLAVAPEERGRGVGGALLYALVQKLHPDRPTATIHVRETNLGAQLYFRSRGYLARAVVRNRFADTGEDAYEMVRTLEGVTEETERKRTKRSSTCD